MPILIAVSGKGGVGKTTLSALLLDELLRLQLDDKILAVDGDPAVTLHFALGLTDPPERTLADLRDALQKNVQAKRRDIPAPILEILAASGVVREVEAQLDLLTMGQREGPGCYCQVNTLLSVAMRALLPTYEYIVIDNEAGLEHINRVRVPRVDFFIVVARPTPPSMAVAEGIIQTAQKVDMELGQTVLVINRADESDLHAKIEGVSWQVFVPEEPALVALERQGTAVALLSEESPARQVVRALVKRMQSGEV